MVAVVIGIGCNDNLVVAQICNVFLNAKAERKVFKFLIFKQRSLSFAEHIFRLSAETENCLIGNIACVHHSSGCRISFRNKNHRFCAFRSVLKMIAAVLEFWNFQGNGLCSLANLFFRNIIDFRTRLHIADNLVFKRTGNIRIMTQPVINGGLRFLYYRRADFNISKFVFRLACEHRIIKTDFKSNKKSAGNVVLFVFFLEKIIYSLCNAVKKSRYVSSAVFSRLTVYKRIHEFIKACRMRHYKFKIITLIGKQLVNGIVLSAHFVYKKILKTVFAQIFFFIAVDFKSRIKVCVVPEALFHHIHIEFVFSEHF